MLAVWLVISAVLIVAEMISMGLTTVWFAIGALAAALAEYLGAGYGIQLIVFASVSLVLLFTTAPLARKHLIKNPEKTNVEGLIGQCGMVVTTIDNDKSQGVVSLNGMEWTARSQNDETIEKGSKVSVVSISGVKVIVKKQDV